MDTEAVQGTSRCVLRGFEDADEDTPDRPTLTPGMVLQATREIGLPSLAVQIQPGGSTIVNFDTIFYAEPEGFARSVNLIGYDVDIAAAPVSYRWQHGDGSAQMTRGAGRTYPHKDVTHQYKQVAAEVSPSVDVTYSVRYRVDGSAWQTIGQTLTATGPDSTLEIREAVAVLSTRQ